MTKCRVTCERTKFISPISGTTYGLRMEDQYESSYIDSMTLKEYRKFTPEEVLLYAYNHATEAMHSMFAEVRRRRQRINCEGRVFAAATWVNSEVDIEEFE